jgi:hypothetical protein
MKVILQPHSRRVKENFERDFVVYDPASGQLQKLRGGRLFYKYEDGKMVPRVDKQQKYVHKNSWPEIQKWLAANRRLVSIEQMSPLGDVHIEVDEYYWPKLERELCKLSVLYEVEEE